jgi:AraC-like DNA-binding protein
MSTIAATSTLAMVRAAEARGIPTSDVLATAGVTVAQLQDPDARLPYSQVMEVWNTLRSRANDSALQLTAPQTLPWGTYRVIDYVVTASATIGEGITRFARFFGLITDAVSLSTGRDGERNFLTIQLADGRPVPPMYVDYVFAALFTRVRFRMRPQLQLLGVELRQPEPADPAPYRELFRAPIRFGAASDQLFFADDEWLAPSESADVALAQLMEEHARMLAHRSGPPQVGFRRDVESAVAATLMHGATAEDVARVLHVSVRTLQRKLEDAGVTFRQVSDATRAQLAKEYLADAKVGIAEVAFLLGFGDQTSFNRAFRRWTSETPGRWRRRHTARSPELQDSRGRA